MSFTSVRTQTFKAMNWAFVLLMFYAPIVYGQTYSTILGDSEIVSVINSRAAVIAAERNLKSIKVCSQINGWNGNPYLANELDSIFTKADFDFVKDQMRNLTNVKRWNKKGLKRVVLTNKNTPKPGAENAQYAFSPPLFSVDKTKLIIREFYLCSYMCSKISIKLFERGTEGKWNYKTTLTEN